MREQRKIKYNLRQREFQKPVVQMHFTGKRNTFLLTTAVRKNLYAKMPQCSDSNERLRVNQNNNNALPK